MRYAWTVTVAAIMSLASLGLATGDNDLPERLPPGEYTPREIEPLTLSDEGSNQPTRESVLKRAKVWREPPRAIEHADLGANPVDVPAALACRYKPDEPDGTTPKFDCVLAGGDVIKVKYGKTAEIPSEVASTRLLSALGFGADQVSLLEVVRCFGCPLSPFRATQAAAAVGAADLVEKTLNFDRYHDFVSVAVERRFPGRPVVSSRHKGWTWHELAEIQQSAGGATRAEVDALRLMAVFLAHWDNKAENQRLVCLKQRRGEVCTESFAFIQDVGAIFGPPKANVRGWNGVRIWSDAESCTVSMESLPYKGATFQPLQISEAGRRFLADRLTRLSRQQITALFLGARIPQSQGWWSPGRSVERWVDAFEDKVRQINDRPPCPSV